MAFEVFVDEIDTDNIGGFDRVMPGSFHTAVVHLEEEGGKKGEMIVDFEILRGTTANQEGKVMRIYFRKDMDKPARKMMLAFAIATGLTTKAALDKHKADHTSPTLDFTTVIGKQVCMNLVEDNFNGKISTKLSWDEIFHPTDKRASHIPLNSVMLAKAGIVLPPGRNPDGAVSTSKPAATKTAAAPTASPAQAANVEDLLAGVV